MRQMRCTLVGGILIAALAAFAPAAFGHDGGMGGGGGDSNPGTSSQLSAARTFYNQGEEYSKKKNWNLAIQAYLEAVRLDPKFVEAWNNLGSCYRKVKQYDKAFEAYKQALDLKPDYPNAHEYMARTYLAMGNKDGAMREYEILKRLDVKMAAELMTAIQANDADLGDES
ncbi:MAG TPA: tetratricopeptide repeat protein [bacterium]